MAPGAGYKLMNFDIELIIPARTGGDRFYREKKPAPTHAGPTTAPIETPAGLPRLPSSLD